jgi:hypothetical protein
MNTKQTKNDALFDKAVDAARELSVTLDETTIALHELCSKINMLFSAVKTDLKCRRDDELATMQK